MLLLIHSENDYQTLTLFAFAFLYHVLPIWTKFPRLTGWGPR